nr:thioesterase family protein [Mesorhizobium sp. WSM4875]
MIDQPTMSWRCRPKQEWQDYNGHMGDFAFGIAFTEALDKFLFSVGFDDSYKNSTGNAIFTLETHLTFLGECSVNEDLDIGTRIVDIDEKRLHLFLSMTDLNGREVATYEVMLMHVNTRRDQGKASAIAMPDEIFTKLKAAFERNSGEPRPKHAGASIGIRRNR